MKSPPPLLASALYRLCLPPGDQAELGDLLEEYAENVVPALGHRGARRWFWSQVLRSIGPSLATPVARQGLRGAAVGLSLGVLVFYGIGVGAATAMSNLGGLEIAYAPRFAGYLVLCSAGAYFAGRLAATRAGETSIPTSFALIAIALLPQAIALLGGGSTEPVLAQGLWALAIPVGVLSGSRSVS